MARPTRASLEPLTTAELRALHALARYETATEAAAALHMSAQTLRNQAGMAYRKLGVNGRVDAFRKMGWLRPPRFMPSAEDMEPLTDPFWDRGEQERTAEWADEADPSTLIPQIPHARSARPN